MSSPRTTSDPLMWEARAQPGRLGDLLRWIDHTLLPVLLADPCCRKADVYTDEHDRAVVILRCAGALAARPEPPTDLLERPAYQWSSITGGARPRLPSDQPSGPTQCWLPCSIVALPVVRAGPL